MIEVGGIMALLGVPGLGTPELIIILVIVLVLFGPKRLPQLGKSLGKTMKSLREGLDGKDEDEGDSDATKTDKAAKASSDAGDDAEEA
jgi:sec-independent protein translocase protein TatA